MRRILQFLLLMFAGITLWSQPTKTITDGDLIANQTYNWSKDTTYLLDGYVFLESGGVLNIEAGTVIKGINQPSSDDIASALIITRGAQIFANGTAEAPIIFTAELDDLADPTDLSSADKGLWGGLIILGNAVIGEDGGIENIEGIPSTEGRAEYGGDDNADNSGVLHYVSIRHGGAELGPDNEINGLTLGGVGSGTDIDYVEIFANSDDGVEVFGGTVLLKHFVSAFPGDDGFDYDESWDGGGQFWLMIQETDNGNYGGEHDGSERTDLLPKTSPQIYNATYIGSGAASDNSASNGIVLKADGAIRFGNSIVTEFSNAGLEVRNASEEDAYKRYLDGDTEFKNNLWYGFGSGNTPSDFIITPGGDPQAIIDLVLASGNQVVDPQLAGISRVPDGMLDPRPNAGSPALGAAIAPPAGYEQVSYIGAFSNSDNWAAGWTALSTYGYFGDLVTKVTSNDIVINDNDLVGGQTYNWTKENTYYLDGYVFLESGGVLNIEAGTVIKGINQPSTDDIASALIITRGAQIFANGTAEAPIIFTAELDDLTDPADLTAADKGLWGGLILLGNAIIGEDGGIENIEGIPSTEGRAEYGGDDDADNSGVLHYVSIRHGGAELGPDNEINGLTLGGVGSGTDIDYVEIFANSDDGVEVFGGTVLLKHFVSAFPGDDGFDYDESWDGGGQFWLMIQETDNGNYGGEHDGSERTDLLPKTSPQVYNATYIGSGATSGNAASNGIVLKADGAIRFGNSIVTEFSNAGLEVRNASEEDAYKRYLDGDTEFKNNLWYGFGVGNTPSDFIITPGGDPQAIIDLILASGNQVIDPQLAGIARMPNGMLDPRPNAGSPALGAAVAPPSGYEAVSYIGAFSNSDNWAAGWTALSTYGYFGDLVTEVTGNDVIIKDEDLVGGQTYNWTKENTYYLDGYVFLESGGVLNIEAGTVIKGINQPSSDDIASALIITRGAQIFANGTAEAPIIFTAELDDLTDPADLTSADKGLWGGLIMLGNAVIGEDGGIENIEGIPSTEGRAEYGGDDNADNSGVLHYVSIRHGGAELGPDNEINGLTLGGVGSGTDIDYVEIFANSDDGVEVFGGTVLLKHFVSAFSGDDGFDYDESWDGGGQFWFMLQESDNGNYGGEHDGSERTDLLPKTSPQIYNATYIGSGATSGNTASNGIVLKADGAIRFGNSIVTAFSNAGLEVRNASEEDAYKRYLDGDTEFKNNLWYGFGVGNTPSDFIITPGGDPQAIIDLFNASSNQAIDPELASISRVPDGMLDPRPNAGSPALGTAIAPPDGYQAVSYIGAFSNSDNWAAGWTALSTYGYFGDLVTTGVGYVAQADGYSLKSYPNPSALGYVRFEVNMPNTESADLNIYDMNGRLVKNVFSGTLVGGAHSLTAQVSDLNRGIYLIYFKSNSIDLTQKLILVH